MEQAPLFFLWFAKPDRKRTVVRRFPVRSCAARRPRVISSFSPVNGRLHMRHYFHAYHDSIVIARWMAAMAAPTADSTESHSFQRITAEIPSTPSLFLLLFLNPEGLVRDNRMTSLIISCLHSHLPITRSLNLCYFCSSSGRNLLSWRMDHEMFTFLRKW